MMLAVFFMMIVAIGMWQSRKMKTMVNCTYKSRSKQKYTKLVREVDGYVVFDKKRFPLMPQYASQEHYDKGLSAFFPTKISAYTFRWNSDMPEDPATGEPAILSPENMNKLRQESALGAYAGSQQTALSGGKSKLGGMDKWMPFIMIGLAIAVGYLIYTNFQDAKNAKVTQQAIIDIYNTFNHMGQPIIPIK